MILVTGANGFIGSALVWELNRAQNAQDDIVAVDAVPLSERNLLRRRRYGKFLSKDELWPFLESDEAKKIQWVLHMGACSSTTEKNWDYLLENNLQYSQRIFQWCADHQVGLVYASSGATYGAGEQGFSDKTDSDVLRPLNLYGDSKVLMDRWAVRQSKTPPHWYALKFFNVFGPNEYEKGSMASVAYKAFQQIRQTGRLKLFRSHHPDYRDGEQMRDFVYVKEITAWIKELMEKKPASGIYNMGYGKARTWMSLAQAVFSAMDKPVAIDWLDVPADIRDQYQYFTEAKMDKWAAAKMSAPQWSLETAVDDYVRQHLSNQEPLL